LSDSNYNTIHSSINKTSSLKSLYYRPRRLGSSQNSLSSVDSESYEEELKDYYNGAVRDRVKDEEVARLEKVRLESIMNMCAEFMKSTVEKEDQQIPEKNSLTNHQKLKSVEEDLTLKKSTDEDQQKEENTQRKNSSKSLTDVDEITRLRDESIIKIEEIQRRICEIEESLSESTNELEIELALVLGELGCEKESLISDEKRCDRIKDQIIHLEENYIREREKQQAIVSKEKERLLEMENSVSNIKNQIDKFPECLRGSMEEKLTQTEEALEEENQRFEDTEFQAFESLSKLDENKEEKQKELIDEKRILEDTILSRKLRVEALEQQILDLKNQHQSENQRLTQERDVIIAQIQQQRKEVDLLEHKHHQQDLRRLLSSTSINNSNTLDASMTSSSKEKHVTCEGSGKKLKSELNESEKPLEASSLKSTLESESPSNSLLPSKPSADDNFSQKLKHLQATTSRPLPVHIQSLSPSMSRVNHLPPSGHQPNTSSSPTYMYRPQPEARWNDCISIGSMDSLDTSVSNWSVANVDSLEKVREMERLIANATAERRRLLAEVKQREEDIPEASESTKSPATSNRVNFNLEETKTSELNIKMRNPMNSDRRQARPMTRYLPVLATDFDLHHHIENSGHAPSTCIHTSLTATSCRGYLTKMGGHIKKWKKRWFVFDRINKTIHYYKNKHENKVRGVIPFQAIENVFFDHLKTHKSPDPALTFCIKCVNRIYFMVAPSSEAMRIWMDVIVTGAEGYTDYMKTYE